MNWREIDKDKLNILISYLLTLQGKEPETCRMIDYTVYLNNTKEVDIFTSWYTPYLDLLWTLEADRPKDKPNLLDANTENLLDRVFAKLSGRDVRILVLHITEGHPLKEVAAILAAPFKTICTANSRIAPKLEKIFKEG